MQKKHWLHTVACLALVRALVLNVYAQEAVLPSAVPSTSKPSAFHSRQGTARSGFGFEGRMGKAVGMTPEQRDAVHGLLAEQRQQHTALQEQTDAKIRALLNPDQQKKFDAFLDQLKQERAARYHRAS